MNDSDIMGDGRKELGIFCCKELALLLYSIVWKWPWISHKCIFDMARKEIKRNHIKCSIKTRKVNKWKAGEKGGGER